MKHTSDRVSDEYWSRINRVLDHIDLSLQTKFTLDELARVACFSKHHFHRLFRAMMGETLFEYIQRRRLEKAARLLRINPRTPITEIADDCGFSDSAAFARGFRLRFGTTASRWRACPNSNLRIANSNQRQDSRRPPADNTRAKAGTRRATTSFRSARVTVERYPEMTVAYLRHVGPFQGNAELFARLFRRLYAWAESRDLVRPNETRIFIISHDSLGITDEQKLRVSVCINVPPHTQTSGAVGKMTIPGGKYARARLALGDNDYAAAWRWMFGTWLPASGYQPDDRPCFEMYPIPGCRRGGRTTVDICIPVRPL